MKIPFVLSLALVVGPVGCGSTEPTPTEAPTPQAPAAPAPEGEVAQPASAACAAFPGEEAEIFGAVLAPNQGITPLTEVLMAPEEFVGKDVFTTGVVRASCTKRGCWMEIRPEDDRGGATLTVRFKNYKFFVPLSSRGAHVAIQGKVLVKTLSADEVAHLEAEGATIPGKLEDGTAKQVQFTAIGVEMCGRGK